MSSNPGHPALWWDFSTAQRPGAGGAVTQMLSDVGRVVASLQTGHFTKLKFARRLRTTSPAIALHSKTRAAPRRAGAQH